MLLSNNFVISVNSGEQVPAIKFTIMAYIEVQHAPELRAIIRQIRHKEFGAALEALISLQAGVLRDDNVGQEGNKPDSQWSGQVKLAVEIVRVRYSLHKAMACSKEE